IATWQVNGTDAGTVTAVGTSVTFTGFQSLTGNTGGDTFVFGNGALVTGSIDGGFHGTGVLDESAYGAPIAVHPDTSSASNIPSFKNTAKFYGTKGGSPLFRPAAGTTWHVTGTDAGTVIAPGMSDAFTDFQFLDGNTGDDTFVFADGAKVTGGVTGGGG